MDFFLDTCIIIYYYDEKDKYHKSTKKLIESNKFFIISYYQDKKEIPFLLFRKKKIISEVIKCSVSPSYRPNLGKFTPKDKIKLNQILSKHKLGEIYQQELFSMKKEVLLLEQNINYFTKNKISRKVITLDELDFILINELNKVIDNKADCCILSSAIQEHKKNPLTVITADKNDWKRTEIKKIVEESKSYNKNPKIEFIQNI